MILMLGLGGGPMDDEDLRTHSSAAAGLGKSHPAVKVSKTRASLLPRWTSFLRQLPSTRESECQELTQDPELSNEKQDISHIYNSNFSSKFLKRGVGGTGKVNFNRRLEAGDSAHDTACAWHA